MSCDDPHEIPHLDLAFLKLVIDLLRHGKSVRFRAPGRSMFPTIREGDAITVTPIAPDSVRRGDIILYRVKCGVVAHRLIRIERNKEGSFRFLFRSDTWGRWDEPVLAEQILGKVVSAEASGRRINIYSGKMKIRLLTHLVASRLKRWIH
jgi:signal peptidase I